MLFEVHTGRGNCVMSKNSSSKSFKVVFWGQAAQGVSRKQLISAFIKLFKLRDPKFAQRYFSGRMTVLKSGLSEAQARAYVRAIKAIGGVARIEACQLVNLEGELARRHRPSFLQPGVCADEMELVKDPAVPRLKPGTRQVVVREPNCKSIFQARDLA